MYVEALLYIMLMDGRGQRWGFVSFAPAGVCWWLWYDVVCSEVDLGGFCQVFFVQCSSLGIPTRNGEQIITSMPMTIKKLLFPS